MKILITGVGGFIGSNFADWLIKGGYKDVIGIDNLSGGYKSNIPKEVKFYNRNLEYDNIKRLFKDVDIVYHMAAYAAEGLSPFMRKFNYRNNLVATANVINACINNDVKRLVYFSSMSVYGKQKYPFNEIQRPNPIDPYGVSKYACEMDIRIAHDQHGLEYCIIRPHNVAGPKQNIWDRYRNVIGIWIYQYLHNQPLTIFGDGSQVRAFTYVKNIMEPIYNAGILSKAKGEIINLGGMIPTTINEILNILLRILDYDKIVHLESRHEVKYAYSTYKKSVNLLGYQEKYTIEDGLIEMVEWARQQKDRKRKSWDNYEINKKIYEFWRK